MSRNKKLLIAIVALVLIGAAAGSAWWFRRSTAPSVTVETLKTRDLEAVVSASGKIQPKLFVNISADTSGRVVNLAVNEGDRVKAGQFLMQIDPRSLRTRVDSGQAALQGSQAALEQARQSVETARVQLAVAQQSLGRQQGLWKSQLTTREALDRAENDVRIAQSALAEREKQHPPDHEHVDGAEQARGEGGIAETRQQCGEAGGTSQRFAREINRQRHKRAQRQDG